MTPRKAATLAATTALATALALAVLVLWGMFRAGPALGHEWYSGLKSPVTGVSCCDDRDCQPTSACVLPTGEMGILAQEGCIPIDWSRVLKQSSPDGETHICQLPSSGLVMCIIMGGGV